MHLAFKRAPELMGSSADGGCGLQRGDITTLQTSASFTASSSSFPSSCLLSYLFPAGLETANSSPSSKQLLSSFFSQVSLPSAITVLRRTHFTEPCFLQTIFKVCLWWDALVPQGSIKMDWNWVSLKHYPWGADNGQRRIPRITKKKRWESPLRVAMEKCSRLTFLGYPVSLHFTLLISRI